MRSPFEVPPNCIHAVTGSKLVDIQFNMSLTQYVVVFADGMREAVDGATAGLALAALVEWMDAHTRIIVVPNG